MNRIILIGNGFDLAHGLPTSYRDFIQSYRNFLRQELVTCNRNVVKDKLCSFILKGDETWLVHFWGRMSVINPPTDKEFFDYLRSSPFTFEMKFTPFMEKIKQSYETRGWVDIENEFTACCARLHR